MCGANRAQRPARMGRGRWMNDERRGASWKGADAPTSRRLGREGENDLKVTIIIKEAGSEGRGRRLGRGRWMKAEGRGMKEEGRGRRHGGGHHGGRGRWMKEGGRPEGRGRWHGEGRPEGRGRWHGEGRPEGRGRWMKEGDRPEGRGRWQGEGHSQERPRVIGKLVEMPDGRVRVIRRGHRPHRYD